MINLSKLLKDKEKIYTILFWVGLILFLAYLFLPKYFGQEKIGSFYEKPEYKARYNLYLFPKDSESKNYNVVGEINAWTDTSSYGEEGSSSYKVYDLEKVEWPNGGSSTFDDCEITEAIKETASCSDNEDREWKIKLGEKEK